METGGLVNKIPKWQGFWIIPLLGLALFSACATTPYIPSRAHAQFEERIRGGLTVALMPPDVKVYQLTVLDTTELMDEWSEAARKNVKAAVGKRLRNSQTLTIHEFDPSKSKAAQEEFEDASSLFRAVALSVEFHALPTPVQFETKKVRLDYTLGPLPAIANASGADALLFVWAVDHISTGGRVAGNVAAIILQGLAAGAGGAGAGGTINWGVTAMRAALVDALTGDILWFSRHATKGSHDLREPASADEFVADVFRILAITPNSKPGTGRN